LIAGNGGKVGVLTKNAPIASWCPGDTLALVSIDVAVTRSWRTTGERLNTLPATVSFWRVRRPPAPEKKAPPTVEPLSVQPRLFFWQSNPST
jgi:hypothetical protein